MNLQEALALIEKYEADTTIAKYYRGIKKQVDDISALFMTINITEETLSKGDDKFFDRYFKFLEKSLLISDNLKKMEEIVTGIKARKAGGVAEKHIFPNDKN